MRAGVLRRLREVPPRQWARRAAERARREGAGAWRRMADRVRSSYSDAAPDPLLRILPAPPLDALRRIAPELAPACARDLEHVFDLLGSGPVRVVHGMRAAGVDGWRYSSAPGGRINAANRAEARRIRALLGAGYTPIDWHLDFKSGFRWDEGDWWRDVAIGHSRGVDVKVPWELSRMQHLPRLACAHALAAAGEPGFASPERYAHEFRDQVLDWIASNPPRRGVNWRMPMDVAMRVASWLVARDLFAAQGVEPDAEFERVFRRSVHEHAVHLVQHLEWNREVRGNHYLANVAGLLFCAAYLPCSGRTDAWLAWAVQELGAETALQFAADGGSFEASTAYHSLSMEMVAWSTALMAALPRRKLRALAEADPAAWKRHPPLRAGAALSADHPRRIRRMVEFAAALTKPDGVMAQIGDNDSGRFLPLRASAVLDPCEPVAVAAAVAAGADAGEVLAAWIGARAARPTPARAGSLPEADGEGATCEILLPGGGALRGARVQSFPDFGVYVFRSDRLWIAFRCGGRGVIALAGHAHEDQLAIELQVDGTDVIADPGTYLYTADPGARVRFRSAAAHAVPRVEPPLAWARRGPTLFELHERAVARCLRCDGSGFAGEAQVEGVVVHREVTIHDDRLVIADRVSGTGRRVLAPFPPPAAEHSPAYGVRGPAPHPPVRPLGGGIWEWRGG